jgi:hypothetical protein
MKNLIFATILIFAAHCNDSKTTTSQEAAPSSWYGNVELRTITYNGRTYVIATTGAGIAMVERIQK